MEFLNKYKYIAIAAAAGLLIGRFLLHPPVEVKTKEVIKYVEKKVEVKDENKNKHVVIIERKLKDGTVEKRTEIKEDTKTKTKTNTEIALDSKKEESIKKGGKITIGVLALKDISVSSEIHYGATVTVPIYGPVKLQAIGTTDKQVGVGAAIEF